ncbi:MAG: amidohydrolase family protein [Gammaproteobacteria bacterium]|nr:amidohydrolase family protein [Gammaproteobacteria bacterium]
MYNGLTVIDADAHKLENPAVFFDFIEPKYRDRVGLIVDSLGDQRVRIADYNPETGKNDLERIFPQAKGLGKGGFRSLHPETTLGAIFNRERIRQMDDEGVDVHVLFGTFNLTLSCLIDVDMAISLCRAYNDYISADCQGFEGRIKPVGVIPLQDVDFAVTEMRRCVEELGMVSVSCSPSMPIPHPKAPDAFPEIRTAKSISHPDFRPILKTAVELDIALSLHGGPGSNLMGGISDHMDTFVLTHIFVQRNQQQHAMTRMIFDGAFEEFPTLRVGFMEGGCGWLPDLAHSCHEHWEKRIRDFDPQNPYRPGWAECTKLLLEEQGGKALLGNARSIFDLLWTRSKDPKKIDDQSLYEHYDLRHRDPMEYFERGQIFLSFEPDDPAPLYLPTAMGDIGKKLVCFSADYGHWDGMHTGCVDYVASNPDYDRDHLEALLSGNSLALYGDRLRNSMPLQSSLSEPLRKST